MTARDVIARARLARKGVTGLEDDAFERPFSDKSIIGAAWNDAHADIEALKLAGYSIVHENEIHGATLHGFRRGMPVIHSDVGRGIVTKVDSAVHVQYERSKDLRGVYDDRWFRLHGHLLRALPDGGVE